jgi:glycosyltransferase involved in cell wall biosynthesis
MKVLVVSTFDISGGAALGAYHLSKSLRSIGIEAEMLVQFKAGDDPVVIGPQLTRLKEKFNWFLYHLDQLPAKLYWNRTRTEFSPAWLPNRTIIDTINRSDADIVNLHWIASGTMPVEDIARIRKPIVWSLHDMWAFTGGCHYDEGCGRYASSCHTCPVLGSRHRADLSHVVFSRKEKTYAKIPSLTVVGLSRWIADCARNSVVFSGRNVVNIPSLIDTSVFSPMDKTIARDLLSLPHDRKLILFGGDGMVGNPRKGYRELSLALDRIRKRDLELVVFGSGNVDPSLRNRFPVHYLGHLPDDLSLRVAYSAADVMIMPSLQEVLGWVSAESLACGTPVVTFDIDGPRDIVEHKVNGYLASPASPASLAEGIDWVLDYPEPAVLSGNSRQTVLNKFESSIVAKRYRDLYTSILSGNQ